VEEVIAVNSPPRKNWKNVGAANAIEIRAGNLSQIWAKLAIKYMSEAELVLGACQIARFNGPDGREFSVAGDIFQPDISRARCNCVWGDRIARDFDDLT
jgi:hypothetical protein